MHGTEKKCFSTSSLQVSHLKRKISLPSRVTTAAKSNKAGVTMYLSHT